jgi:hypothetical protein
MQPITVKPELYERVKKAAKAQNTSVDDFLSQGIRYYLWELDRRKISEESKIYHQRHEELKAQYLGMYIAMLEGEVVDHDHDFSALYQRVRQHFGQTAVMITQVKETAELPLTRRGFRMGGSSK